MGDVALLYISLILALFIGFWGSFDASVFLEHAIPFSLLYLVWLVIFYVLDCYDLSLPPSSAPFLARYVLATTVLFATGVLFFYAFTLTDITPKTNLLVHVGLFGVLAFLWRLLFSAWISPLSPWRIGILEMGPQATELQEIIQSLKHHGYQYVRLESEQGLEDQLKAQRVDVVILPPDFLTQDDHIQTLYRCLGTGVTFLDLAQAYELFARRIPLTTIDHQWFIRNVQERERGFSERLKRLFDVTAALVILIVSLPLWVLAALAIKLEGGGEVFYTQERVGKNRSTFFIRKFRTMKTDAEAHGAQWAVMGDPRATRVGAFLRRTHLDELPQMLNVLHGELSLVGPRPERPMFVENLEREIPHYRVRHFVKPGFTGWAQIKFRYARSVTDSRRKFEYDLYYIKNRSMIFDVLILLKTLQLFFRREAP